MPTLIELMKDPSVVVRDTTAWTVGRICELLPEAAINEIYLAPLLQCLIEGLGAEPRVASNVCWVSGSMWSFAARLQVPKCGGSCPVRRSRPSPKQPTRPRTLQRTKRSPAPTVCPPPLRSLSRNSWRPRTGEGALLSPVGSETFKSTVCLYLSAQARRSPEQPALGRLRGSDGDRQEQRQGLLPCGPENHAGHHGAAAAGPADGGEPSVAR